MDMRALVNRMVHETTDPNQIAGLLANASISPENMKFILTNYGQYPMVWLMLIHRADVTVEQLTLASQVPDAQVLSAVFGHHHATPTIRHWIKDYALQLVETGDPERQKTFTALIEYADRVFASEGLK